MLTQLLLIAGGLALLVIAGDLLVRGAVNLSLRLGIPALIVGLTVVAFGTSAPELLVSVAAVLDGVPGIALGNVVGSNIANVLLVIGIPALISAIRPEGGDTRESFVFMIAASVLFIALCAFGPLGTVHGLVLLAGLALMLWRQIAAALAHRAERRGAEEAEALEGADLHMPWWKILGFLALGLAGLPLGADLLVSGATVIARDLGISETVIGLTLVAVGTSLPELATSVTAAIKGRADVALGNVIGSNIFNLLGIIGVAALVGPIPVDPAFLSFDLWVMLGASLLLLPVVWFGRAVGRGAGLGLAALYGAYVVVLL